uniref:Putative XRE family transcriptional regulator n=1 Tax=Candidatus Nitrotoga fabula TaxID=2182327 RepID=A0A2X0QVQ2_9PROT|nr:putative XRE family transcriptional regulator [Candidatus Nitrotoga fabula]
MVQGSVDNLSDQIEVNDDGSPVDMPVSVGSTLREAREHLGLSIEDVENRLKFAPHQIEALEADDYGNLPEMSFVRRFVRSYARLLKLDPEPLLASLPAIPVQPSLYATSIEVEMPFQDNKAGHGLKIVWLLTIPVVIAVVWVVFVWLNHREPTVPHETMEPVDLPVAMTPASAVKTVPRQDLPVVPLAAQTVPVPGSVAVVPAADNVASSVKGMEVGAGGAAQQSFSVQLQFKEKSWVRVKDHDGRVLLSKINPAGSEQKLDGRSPLSVEIGNARGVRLYYRGKPVDLAPYYNDGRARLTLE